MEIIKKLVIITTLLSFLFINCFSENKETTKILKYEKNSEITVSGIIQEVRVEKWYGNKKENYIITMTDEKDNSLKIDLGCTNLYKNTPKPGDKILITGSKVKDNSSFIVLAKKVTINNNEIAVRNNSGVPNWGNSSKMRNMRKKHFMYKMRKSMRRH